MSVSIDILPFSNSVDLDGDADPSSAYSLSGHVAISFNSSSSIFDRRRTIRLLLQSLVITFEGQTELVTPETGYTPYRVCLITKELAPTELVELSNEGHENSDKPCTWNVVFDLPIPGWLPPSCIFGSGENGPAGTRYSLHATAKFNSLEDPSCQLPFGARLWSLFCTTGVSSTRLVKAPKRDVTVNRITTSPIASSSTIPYKTFCVQVSDDEESVIPAGVLSKIRVTASVPENVGMEDESFQLRLRVRAEDLDAVHCDRLRMTTFSVDLHQQEKYRTQPSHAYTARYPVPEDALQPPKTPLLDPHPLERLHALGMVAKKTPLQIIDRSFSLNPEECSGLYQLSGTGYIFAPVAQATASTCTWYAMEPTIPFARQGAGQDGQQRDWAGEPTLRASGTSPLFAVRHQVHLSMMCTYDVDGDRAKRVIAKLQFVIPIQFVRKRAEVISLRPMLEISPMHSRCSSSDDSGPSSTVESPVSSVAPHYYANTLPAYSQLFDANGDRKLDYSLPVYTPYSPSSSVELGR